MATFKIKLQDGRGKVPKGYLGVNERGWCIMSPTALVFEEYDETPFLSYLRVTEGPWKGYYLSLGDGDYVGLFTWHNASRWEFCITGHHDWNPLKSERNRQNASFHDNGSDEHVYAKNDYPHNHYHDLDVYQEKV
jgi:hypothetical protein